MKLKRCMLVQLVCEPWVCYYDFFICSDVVPGSQSQKCVF